MNPVKVSALSAISGRVNALSLAEFLEREAGYELLSLLLIVGGMALVDGTQRAQAADRLITFALGVLARSMGGTKRPAAPITEPAEVPIAV
jgi:hypothetical protein